MRWLVSMAVALGLALTGSAAPAQAPGYIETFDEGSDPADVMAGVLLIGEDGAWSGRLEDGVYKLANRDKSGAIRYFHLGRRGSAARPGSVKLFGVDVAGRFSSDVAGAGLIYRFDRQAKTYFAFVITRDGYGVWQRGRDGFRRVAAGSNEAIKAEEPNSLIVQLASGRARLFVNETQVLAHSVKGGTGGDIGIIAIDRGEFLFDNFKLAGDRQAR